MNKELMLKKCSKCGAMVKVLKDCKCESDCGIKCCGEKMKKIEPNSVEAAFEKHIPTYEIKDGKIYVRVNHVMEENHYIEWISIVFDKNEVTTYFNPGEEPTTCFKYISGTTIYAYCNKHELWKIDVK